MILTGAMSMIPYGSIIEYVFLASEYPAKNSKVISKLFLQSSPKNLPTPTHQHSKDPQNTLSDARKGRF